MIEITCLFSNVIGFHTILCQWPHLKVNPQDQGTVHSVHGIQWYSYGHGVHTPQSTSNPIARFLCHFKTMLVIYVATEIL